MNTYYCPDCNIEIDEVDNFCKKCGANFNNKNNVSSSSFKIDIMLLLFITIMILSSIGQFIVQLIFPNWYATPVKYIQGIFWILRDVSIILLPLAISNKTLKIIGMIVSILLIITLLYKNISFLLMSGL